MRYEIYVKEKDVNLSPSQSNDLTPSPLKILPDETRPSSKLVNTTIV